MLPLSCSGSRVRRLSSGSTGSDVAEFREDDQHHWLVMQWRFWGALDQKRGHLKASPVSEAAWRKLRKDLIDDPDVVHFKLEGGSYYAMRLPPVTFGHEASRPT